MLTQILKRLEGTDRVLLFERDAGQDFKPPDVYPERSLVTASTHVHQCAGSRDAMSITVASADGPAIAGTASGTRNGS